VYTQYSTPLHSTPSQSKLIIFIQEADLSGIVSQAEGALDELGLLEVGVTSVGVVELREERLVRALREEALLVQETQDADRLLVDEVCRT
jgi:hypothetical protein